MLEQSRLQTMYTTEKGTLFSVHSKIILFLLFLAGMNFAECFYYFVFIAFAIFIFGNSRLRLNSGFVSVLFFSSSLAFFWDVSITSVTSMLRCFTFPLCYIMGYHFLNDKEDINSLEKKIKSICAILSLGPFAHLVLNLVTNMNEDVGRNTIDFWADTIISATGQAALGCLMVGLSIAFIFSRSGKFYKFLAIFSLATIIYYNLILAGRSLFVMTIIVSIISVLYYFKKSTRKAKKFKIVILTTFVVLLLILLYNSNAWGIKDAVESSNFYKRFFYNNSKDITQDTRFDYKSKYLKYLMVYWFGGGKIHDEVGGYAHDLYLDTYDEAGIFAFIFIVIISINSLVKLWHILKKKTVGFETKQILLCLYAAMHIEFWIEPILAGMPWLLAIFFIIHGMVTKLDEGTTE